MIFSELIKRLTAVLLALMAFSAPAALPAEANPNVAVLAFGLFGAQSVFKSEATGAASIIAQRLGANPVIVRANTKIRDDVTVASIGDALAAAGQSMDRENDVMVVILTSHGSQAGVAVQAGRRLEILSPADLAGMLNRSGVRHRVVIISACYSGVFLRPLADDDTLVITAADADHSSFGCRDKVKWTYFGDAFFNKALRHAADLRSAFAEARTLVSQREMRDGFPSSNPQIAGGKNIELVLGGDVRQGRNGSSP
ncbi:MAG TPA: C13 family peptidase [Xanthobacteraceae bacterium]|nr:C13 family peptidase [Xanthobacteraceae bacterium]